MEQLKEILGEELFTQISAKLGDKKLLIDDGKLIPKYRLEEVSDNLKAQKELVKSYEQQVGELKKSVAGNEEITKKVSALEGQIAEQRAMSDAKVSKLAKSFAVKEGLLNAGVEDSESRELLALKFDTEKLELDETGRVKGFDELVKPLKEHPSLKALFGQKRIAGQEHQDGQSPIASEYSGDKNPFSKKGLNLYKQLEIQRANPELALKLRQSAI